VGGYKTGDISRERQSVLTKKKRHIHDHKKFRKDINRQTNDKLQEQALLLELRRVICIISFIAQHYG